MIVLILVHSRYYIPPRTLVSRSPRGNLRLPEHCDPSDELRAANPSTALSPQANDFVTELSNAFSLHPKVPLPALD